MRLAQFHLRSCVDKYGSSDAAFDGEGRCCALKEELEAPSG